MSKFSKSSGTKSSTAKRLFPCLWSWFHWTFATCRLGRPSPWQGCWWAEFSELPCQLPQVDHPAAAGLAVPDPPSCFAHKKRGSQVSYSMRSCCFGNCPWGNLVLYFRLCRSSQRPKHHHLSDLGFVGNLPINFSDTTCRYSLRSCEEKKKKKKAL